MRLSTTFFFFSALLAYQQSCHGFLPTSKIPTPVTRVEPTFVRLMSSPRERNAGALTPHRDSWLNRATARLLESEPGSLQKGKWHQLVSMLNAWLKLAKDDPQAPLVMETILKRLSEERRAGNEAARATMEMYNTVLDAWACAALFGSYGRTATKRAREILMGLQEVYETEPADEELRPNRRSFNLVHHAVCRTEGFRDAMRHLSWMEYLHKSGKNPEARPTKQDYVFVLEKIANSRSSNAGQLAEAYLRHMSVMGIAPDTFCYNIAIKAHTKAKKGRESAEHAERILSEMDAPKDIVTYSSVISAWATSGMRRHAAARAEELLQEMKDVSGIRPNAVVLNNVMSAWVRSRNPAAVQRTKEILSEMEESQQAPPDLMSYNTHLHALSTHSSNRTNAQLADSMLRAMERRYDTGQADFGPNLFSYNLVLDAWSKARSPESAAKAGETLKRLIKRESVDPDTFSFNKVLQALSRSSMRNAAETAEELVQYMEDAHKMGIHSNAKPDVSSYTSVIMAFSRSGRTGSAHQAERLFNHLKYRYMAGEKDLKPNRLCYNSVIAAWANGGEGTLGARKAEALLREMQEQFDAGDRSLAPDIITYNTVLNSWARSGTRCCGHKAESYLQKMWELYNAGDEKVKPNDFSYNTVINAISKSKNEGKAQKALRILRRMDKLYQAGNKETRPNEVTYTAVLNSCASPAVRDPRIRRKAFDTAIFTWEELQASHHAQPNQVTYGTFITACANLIPEDDDFRRRSVIKAAFEQCCRDGQVGEMVLARLRDAAPADLFEELLAEAVGCVATVRVEDLPQEWRCNLRDKNKR